MEVEKIAKTGSCKNMDKAFEEFLTAVVKGAGKAIVNVFKGIKKLNEKKNLILFFSFGIISIISYLLKKYIYQLQAPIYIRGGLFALLLLSPFIYLGVIGSNIQNSDEPDKYTKLFMEIAFKGKDGKYPVFLKAVERDRKLLYTFKSNISLDEWKANKSKIETALNVNILDFEQANDKKIVQITTVPADFKIPTMIKWTDDNICKDDGVLRLGESALSIVQFDLNKTPHCLFAGETGSGKSVLLRTCLWQMITKGAKVYMIDFKGGVEFGLDYEEFGEVITERKRALKVLTQLCKENEERLALFRNMRAKNLAEFNRKTGKNLCRIGVFCDEIAEMLDKTGVSKEDKPLYEQIEAKLATLARLSRATGINLFLGVQRPDAKILPGQIKNNIPVRVSGRFADKTASEIVLGTTAAVNLPEIKGRFLYKVGNEVIPFQSFYFDDDTMLHKVNVKQGGTLTDMQTTEKHAEVSVKEIKIYNGEEEYETASEEIDLNFDYEAALKAPEPDYKDEDDEEE